MKTPALLSAALLLLLLCPGTPAAGSRKAGAKPSGCNGGSTETHFTVKVTNSVTPSPDKSYTTNMACRGILLGGLRRLNDSQAADFNFTYTENKDYGPFLTSVNGLYGNAKEHTYWQLWVNDNMSDVGIGCVIPETNDRITLNYAKVSSSSLWTSKWESQSNV